MSSGYHSMSDARHAVTLWTPSTREVPAMTDSPSPVDTPAPSNGPRWWPLIAIPIAEAAWLTWVWQDSAIQRQAQVLKTIGGLGAGVVALLVWLLAFSRLRWKTRLTVLAVFLLPVVIGAALFRPAGVTGDLVPIFVLRWSKAAHLAPADRRHRLRGLS